MSEYLKYFLIMLSQVSLVVGQLFLKHAVRDDNFTAISKKAVFFGAGILSMTAWFFLWLYLLRFFELSYLFPFEGISPVLITFGAYIFLKEKLTAPILIGASLISVGVFLVSSS